MSDKTDTIKAEKQAEADFRAEQTSAPAGELATKVAKNSDPAHSAPSRESAQKNAAAQSGMVPAASVTAVAGVPAKTPKPKTDAQLKAAEKAKQDAADDAKRIADSKLPPDYSKSEFALGGVTKQLREEGAPPAEIGEGVHKVQQGGGGAVIAGDTGTHIR